MLASSCSASSRRPCAAAKEAMVSFMPPSSWLHVPSKEASSARCSRRLWSIAVFMARISAASRSVVTRSSRKVSATSPSSSRPAYRMSYERSPYDSALAPAATWPRGRVIDRLSASARKVTRASTAREAVRSRTTRSSASRRSWPAVASSSVAARSWMPRRESMRAPESASQRSYEGQAALSGRAVASRSRTLRTARPGSRNWMTYSWVRSSAEVFSRKASSWAVSSAGQRPAPVGRSTGPASRAATSACSRSAASMARRSAMWASAARPEARVGRPASSAVTSWSRVAATLPYCSAMSVAVSEPVVIWTRRECS